MRCLVSCIRFCGGSFCAHVRCDACPALTPHGVSRPGFLTARSTSLAGSVSFPPNPQLPNTHVTLKRWCPVFDFRLCACSCILGHTDTRVCGSQRQYRRAPGRACRYSPQPATPLHAEMKHANEGSDYRSTVREHCMPGMCGFFSLLACSSSVCERGDALSEEARGERGAEIGRCCRGPELSHRQTSPTEQQVKRIARYYSPPPAPHLSCSIMPLRSDTVSSSCIVLKLTLAPHPLSP